MSKRVLVTFPGKFGDILWSLATAKHIANVYQTKVDFGIMPQYHTLLLFLSQQEYIKKVFTIDDWECTGSPHGDQPWSAPARLEQEYDHTYHLGYRGHPSALIGGPNVQLIDFIAMQHGFKLLPPVLPFMIALDGFALDRVRKPYVAYAFNEYMYEHKLSFLNLLRSRTQDVNYVDVGSLPWSISAATIKHSALFLGCRSSNWVIANGLNKPILTFEPHPERNLTGTMGSVFGCSYGQEHAIVLSQVNDIEGASSAASTIVREFISKEKKHENAKAVAR